MTRLAVLLCAVLALSGVAGRAAAQTTYECSSYSGTNCNMSIAGGQTSSGTPAAVTSSTMTVTGATGPVSSIKLVLEGVNSSTGIWQGANSYQGLCYSAFILQDPNGDKFALLGSTGSCGDALSNGTITIADSASQVAPPYNAPNVGGSWPSSGATVRPSSYWDTLRLTPLYDSSPGDLAQTDGSATFGSKFTSATADGQWKLYLADSDSVIDYPNYVTDPVSISGWQLIFTFSTLAAPTVTLNSGTNPSYTSSTSSSVTLTASVTGSQGIVNGGTVSFTANGSAITCSGGNQVVSNGSATCVHTFSTEGVYSLQAAYSGNSTTYGPGNSNTVSQLVINHTTNPSGNTYCNPGSLSTPGFTTSETVYPSYIQVPNSVSQSVGEVSVQLNGLQSSNGTSSADVSTSFMLVSPGGSHNLDFLAHAENGSPQPSVNLTIADGNALAPSNSVLQSGSYGPTDDGFTPDTFPTLAGDPAPPSPNYPLPYGGSNAETLQQAFSGAAAAGNWLLYIVNDSGIPLSLSSGWCVDLTLNTGAATTTSLPARQQSTYGQSATITATVTSSGSPVTTGTVTFFDNTTGTTLGSPVALDGSGKASYTSSAFAEGDHKITATYNGSGSYNTSFGTTYQRVDDATAIAAVNNTTWQYCNVGQVALATGSNMGAYTPNPSNIFVTNFPGTLNSVAVDLNQFAIVEQQVPPKTEALVEGPGGAALDFFSNTGDSISTVSNGNYIFEDSAGAEVSNGVGTVTPGTYKPTYYLGSGSDSFFSSQSGYYNAPGTFNTAGPIGTATFASTFPSGGNPDGTWSLFFNQTIASANPAGASQGWCVQLTENPPAVTVQLPNTSTFTQGQQGVSFTVDVSNPAGPGSTGDPTGGSAPLTVTDTLDSAFSYANFSGSGWSCSVAGQTVTCTNDSAVASGNSYPTLTIDLNVSNTASGTINNSASVQGAGVATTSSNTDAISILPAPLLSVTKSANGTFTQGSTAEWDVVVSNTVASSITNGTVTVVDTLPSGETLNNASGTGWSCGGATTVTCTSTQGVSGGGSFNTLAIIVNVPTNSPTSVLNTAGAYGGGDLTHTSLGTAANSNTAPANVVQVPATIGFLSSQTQSTAIGTAFGNLAVTVKDAGGVVIPNYSSVTFTASIAGSGATGTFSNSTGTTTVATNGSGIADPGIFTANDNSGSYTVTVTAGSAGNSFSLTNTAIAPTITWTPATTIIYGDAGANVRNATTACSPGCGTFSYSATPTGGGSTTDITTTTATLVAGTYNIVATFNPSSNGYNSASDPYPTPLTVSGESVWITSSGGTGELAGNGYGISAGLYPGGSLAAAIDSVGNVWTIGTGSSLLVETSQVGTHATTIASGMGGLSAPAGIAIDGASQVWVTNGNGSVSEFTNAGGAVSPSGGFTDPSLSTPGGIAIDAGGTVWVANQGNNSVTRILGAAAPAAPLATAAANNTTGARP